MSGNHWGENAAEEGGQGKVVPEGSGEFGLLIVYQLVRHDSSSLYRWRFRIGTTFALRCGPGSGCEAIAASMMAGMRSASFCGRLFGRRGCRQCHIKCPLNGVADQAYAGDEVLIVPPRGSQALPKCGC
jgi:hypothetical protein